MSTYSITSYPAKDLPEQFTGLVFSKWLRSLRYGNDYFKLIETKSYYEAYHRYICAVLGRVETVVRIAALSDDPDVVLGFSVYRHDILEYVHVHKDMRGKGIGTRLVPKDINVITHLTKTGLTIWASKYKQWKFNPFC